MTTPVRTARLKLLLARDEYRYAVLAARAEGKTIRAIAAEAGVTHGAIHQLIKSKTPRTTT